MPNNDSFLYWLHSSDGSFIKMIHLPNAAEMTLDLKKSKYGNKTGYQHMYQLRPYKKEPPSSQGGCSGCNVIPDGAEKLTNDK